MSLIEQNQRIIAKYRASGEQWPATKVQIARWAIEKKLWDIHWQDDQFANRFLEGESESKLYRAIREDKQKVWDFRLKIIAALTGLIGTAIGLIAILRR